MNERWMHKPRTVNVWEARSSLRWGSKHEGYFKTEDETLTYAEKKIVAAGGIGRISHIERYSVGGIVYYHEFHEDDF